MLEQQSSKVLFHTRYNPYSKENLTGPTDENLPIAFPSSRLFLTFKLRLSGLTKDRFTRGRWRRPS